ncbi:cold-inducible protein YdjO-related protein [Paenibacillus filicis]|uniref:Cold-inducible protein YdjO-related protein n=1 Tax=Paenibacillus gyeongsangnamensis TaxID=3388067 RepID=A0ABT4Q523_9BACL|nr:cold-inducible protein YdjO-related protein [Paenibacillus filicis]MCZ8511896.1 cold-inducible protein YdjO-related protein [Paenibacillus filicis]
MKCFYLMPASSNTGEGKTIAQEEGTKPELRPTVIWKCKDAACKAWVREEFTEAEYPACPICQGPTIRSFKHLPIIAAKSKRKGKKPK